MTDTETNMFNYKRIGVVVMLIVMGSFVMVLGADTAIMGINTYRAKWAADEEAHKVRMYNAQRYDNCIKEKYPTLVTGTFGGWVDSRTGTRFDIHGTEQDVKCQARVYGR